MITFLINFLIVLFIIFVTIKLNKTEDEVKNNTILTAILNLYLVYVSILVLVLGLVIVIIQQFLSFINHMINLFISKFSKE
jgi:hypothetical protein